MRTQAKQLWQLMVSVLREIFDENAYARFLEREGVPSSRVAYTAFLREREAAMQRRPRCC